MNPYGPGFGMRRDGNGASVGRKSAILIESWCCPWCLLCVCYRSFASSDIHYTRPLNRDPAVYVYAVLGPRCLRDVE